MNDKKGNKKKKLMRLLAIVLAALMALPLLAAAISSMTIAHAVTQGEIDELISEGANLEEERKQLESELTRIKGDKEQAVRQKELLDSEMMNLQAQIANTEATIETYNVLIAQKEVELAAAEEDEREQYELFCRRVRAMEEAGSTSYLSILFGASDFSDLLSRINMVNDVIAYDNAVAAQLEQIRIEIAEAKADLEDTLAAQEAERDKLEGQKVSLESKVVQAQQLVNEIMEKEDEYATAIAEFKAAEEELNNVIAKKQKELEAQIAAANAGNGTAIVYNTGSGYYWPLPGYYKLSSLYGPRTHPITGKYHSHTGIDIPAPYGTPIYAARGGVILLARYHSSYGNYVTISHGSSDSTLYAHMSSYCVSEGQVVEQGQVIGYVGSTGSSTGNHLHLEVREGGSRINPAKAFPGLQGTLYSEWGNPYA